MKRTARGAWWSRDWLELWASGKPSRPYRSTRLGSPRTLFVRGGRQRVLSFQVRAFASVHHQKVGKRGVKSLKDHLRYLERAAAKVLGPGVVSEMGSKTGEWDTILPGEKWFHKIVVSPEAFWGLDPETFALELMDRVARSSGIVGGERSLNWKCYVHTDTANPHFHFVVRGVSLSGDEVRIPKRVIRSFHRIANDISTSGKFSRLTSLDRDEFSQASRLDRMMPHHGESLDDILLNLPDGIRYRSALEWIPVTRRRAFHARVTFLRHAGILEVDRDGCMIQISDASNRLDLLKRKRDELLSLGPLSFSRTEKATIDCKQSKPTYGLVTSFRHFNGDARTWATFETVNDLPILVEIDSEEFFQLLPLANDGNVFKLSSGKFTLMAGNPRKRLAKLRAKGNVVAAIFEEVLDAPKLYSSSLGDSVQENTEDLNGPDLGTR